MSLMIEADRVPKDLIPWTKRVPEPTPETADEYTALAENSFKDSDRALAEFLATVIPYRSNVVDVGCGPAFEDIELLKLRPDIQKVYALDLDRKMLENAKSKAKDAKLEDKFAFTIANMTMLEDAKLPNGSFVFSNTAAHSLPTLLQLNYTFKGIRSIIGETGGLYFRDLIRPENARQAKEFREEVLGADGDLTISKRGLELFTNSQRAGFTEIEVNRSAHAAGLAKRGRTLLFGPPNSRYIAFEVKAKPAA